MHIFKTNKLMFLTFKDVVTFTTGRLSNDSIFNMVSIE